jgi:hypothetical protein
MDPVYLVLSRGLGEPATPDDVGEDVVPLLNLCHVVAYRIL